MQQEPISVLVEKKKKQGRDKDRVVTRIPNITR